MTIQEQFHPITEVMKRLSETVDPYAIFAGGCPVDLLAGRMPNDVDVYINSPFVYPDGMVALLKDIFKGHIENDHMTVNIPLRGSSYYTPKTNHQVTIKYKNIERTRNQFIKKLRILYYGLNSINMLSYFSFCLPQGITFFSSKKSNQKCRH